MSGFDEVFDYVVVGSGAGSMAAALVMRDAGKSVVVLEKTQYIGGTTARSGGAMWVPNNRYMKQAGIPDSTEKAMEYLNILIDEDPDAPAATPERRLKYVTESPRMIDFVADHGVVLTRTDHWPDYSDHLPGGSVESRSVFSEPFDTRRLGEWESKLRPGMLPLPINLAEIFPIPGFLKDENGKCMVMVGTMNLGEMMKMQHFRKSWAGRWMMMKVGIRWALARFDSKHFVSAGAGLQGQMMLVALKAGTDMRVNTGVKELIEEGGRVTGVVTEKDGKPWRIGANLGVLVNAGGFSHNQEMRDTYIPGTRVEWSSATEGDTGEMIQEMMRHGAAIAQMDARVGNQTTPLPGYENWIIKPAMQSVTGKPHAILVDQTGVRYQTEGGSYSAYCAGILARNKIVPALPSWAIFDIRLLKNYMFGGGGTPGAALANVDGWVAAGYMKRGDTIEELAKQIPIDPDALRATVDRFNGFVDKGVDEDFHRGANAYDAWLGDRYREGSASLGRIDEAPFFAVPVNPGDMTTYGGVMTDVNSRVLRADGSVIEGLYATGISTASAMGRSYPGGGASVGPSMTFGYIAARHAAGLDNQP